MRDQAQGVLLGVEAKLNRSNQPTGWYRLSINTGAQYPVKVDTNDAAMAMQAQQMTGQPVVAVFDVTESGLNPNTGRPYTNRRLVALSGGGAAPAYTPPPSAIGNLAPMGQMPQPVQPMIALSAPATFSSASPAPERQRDLSEQAVRRIIWLSCLQATCTLVANSPTQEDRSGSSVIAITDALYRKAREVERGSLEHPTAPPPASPVVQQGLEALQQSDPGPEPRPEPVPYDTFPEGF